MSTETQNNALLEDFQRFLQQERPEPYATDGQPDLNSLLAELTSLKTEVKAESRQFKGTLDSLNSALETVQEDNKALTVELTASARRFEQQHADMVRAMLLDMVDLYERLSSGIDVLQNYRPVNALFKHSRKKDVRFIQRFKEGQLMTIKRFEQFLQRYQVRKIECVGQLLDPLTMIAVETAENSKFDNGIVLEELRTGFLYQNQVLRLAEVKVNKTKTG